VRGVWVPPSWQRLRLFGIFTANVLFPIDSRLKKEKSAFGLELMTDLKATSYV
jgi:hypothetical protein